MTGPLRMKTAVEATVRRMALSGGELHFARGGPVPVMSLESFTSTPWASATFEGHRHEFVIRVEGEADAVERLVDSFEGSLDAEELTGEDVIFADLERVDTDLTLDGHGGASCLVAFEALTLAT